MLEKINFKQLSLLFYAFSFIFCIFLSYALLRPIRDALGLHGGTQELKWLFLATFIAVLLCSFLAVVLSSKVSRKSYFNYIFIFFSTNLIIFFILMKIINANSIEFLWLCRVFYVWTSVFNMFIISLAWTLLNDAFSATFSKKTFGIIASGASLGSIFGASLVSTLKTADLSLFFAFSCLLLFFALFLKRQIILLCDGEQNRFLMPLKNSNPLAGCKLVINSKYLLAIAGFILLLSTVSTFLYMEQARVIAEIFTDKESRVAAFAKIDLIVQSLSFFIQIFLTGFIAKNFGLEYLLSLVGFVICLGFIFLAFIEPNFFAIALVISIRRVGEYAMVKPAREMLFTKLNADEKYKAKIFLDTVVYRAGDSISATIEGILAKISIMLVLLCGSFFSALWAIIGYKLGKKEKNL